MNGGLTSANIVGPTPLADAISRISRTVLHLPGRPESTTIAAARRPSSPV
jgi:hypothetical protein